MRYIYQSIACLIFATSMMASDNTQLANHTQTTTPTSCSSELMSTCLYPIIGYATTYAGLHAAKKLWSWYFKQQQWNTHHIAYYDGYDASFSSRRLASTPILGTFVCKLLHGYYRYYIWHHLREVARDVLQGQTYDRPSEESSLIEDSVTNSFTLGANYGSLHFLWDYVLEYITRTTTTLETRTNGQSPEACIKGISTHGSRFASFNMPPSQLLESDIRAEQDMHDPHNTILLASRNTEHIIRSQLQALQADDTEQQPAQINIITDHEPLLPRLPRLRTIHDTGPCDGMPVWTVRPRYIDYAHANDRPEYVSRELSVLLYFLPQLTRDHFLNEDRNRSTLRAYLSHLAYNHKKRIGIREIDNVEDPNTQTPNAHGAVWDTICYICHEDIYQNDHHRLSCSHGICTICWDDFKTNYGRQGNDGVWRYICPFCREHRPIENVPEHS